MRERVRALLVEDNPGDVRLLREALAEDCAVLVVEVVVVDTLAGALAALDREPLDVVLLDLGLPDAQGIEVVARLRAHEPRVAIVVVTGSDDEDLALESLRRGAQDYLTKGEATGPLVRRAIRHAIERKRLQARLAASEARYRTLVRASPDAIIQLDCQGDIDYASPRAMELLGVGGEARMVGTHALDWVGDDDLERAKAKINRVFGGDMAGEECLALRRADGRTFIGEVSAASLCDDEGAVTGVVLAIRDVTARRRAEEALAESELRLREVAAAVGEGIVMRDALGGVVFVNTEAERLLGWKDDEAKGRNAHDLFHGTHVDGSLFPASECPINKVMREGERYRGEDFFQRKGGSFLPVSVISTPIFRGGELVGSVLAFHDISDQIALRRELQQTLSTQQAILDNTMVGIALIKHGRFAWVNPKFEELFGFGRGELREKRAESLFPDPQEYQNMRLAAHPYLDRVDGYSGEHRARRRDGSTFWCHLSGKRLDPEDTDKGSLWIVRDITLRKTAVNALEELYRNLEKRVVEEVNKNREMDHMLIRQSRLAAMGEMISYIAHQWRQPLNVLSLVHANLREGMHMGDLAPTQVDELVDTADRLVRGMSTTIDDFRNFFRPDRERVSFHLDRAVKDSLKLVRPSFETHSVAIEYLAEADPVCKGYPNELSQVILNLLSNAKDAVADTGRSGWVRLKLWMGEDGRALLEVSDSGGGIAPEDLERIFEPYYTTKETGTGIGLYMSRMLMEHMGGEIRVTTSEAGAVFTLALPLGRS